MALRGAVEARCPKGCAARDAEVWSFVRGDRDPELREALLAGELNLLVCEECGGLFYPDAAVVYYDPSARLLVFVFPESYQADEGRWRRRMQEDYEQLRSVLRNGEALDVEPSLVFGMEPLRELLRREDAVADEVAVAAILAKELKLRLLSVDRRWARERAVPWTLPCRAPSKGEKPDVAGAVAGVETLLKANDRLTAYRRWLGLLAVEKTLPPTEH